MRFPTERLETASCFAQWPSPSATRCRSVFCSSFFALIGALAAPARIDGSAAASGNGTVVLAGHRDTHFSFPKYLVRGDRLALTDREGRCRPFRVVRRDIADARMTGACIEPADGLVLITFYPFEAVDTSSPLRCVVTALPDGTRRAEEGRAILWLGARWASVM